MDPLTVGVLGCGTISDAYFATHDAFDQFEITACADLERERAAEAAAEHDLTAYDPAGLYESDVEAIVNLTPPTAHEETVRRALESGKHVYVEKPLATTAATSSAIRELAADRGLLVGAAPDTFLGAGLQTARSVLESGRIGDPVGATAVWTSGGHERWHPNPDFYYREGGGPLFDMGPYYVTALVSLLGPVRRASGSVRRTFERRTIESEPRRGDTIDVEVPTHETGLVDFAAGGTATLLLSFDAPGGSSLSEPAFEIYGTEATLRLPDPNRFDGTVRVVERGGESVDAVSPTHEYTAGRGAGVADLALAVRSDWEHRTDADLAHHVLETLEGIRSSSDRDEHVAVDSRLERPAPVPPSFPDHDAP